MADNGKRGAVEPEGVVDLVERVSGQMEGALNDHSVGIAEAIRSANPGPDVADGLRAVARAIDNLAEAIREGNARR